MTTKQTVREAVDLAAHGAVLLELKGPQQGMMKALRKPLNTVSSSLVGPFQGQSQSWDEVLFMHSSAETLVVASCILRHMAPIPVGRKQCLQRLIGCEKQETGGKRGNKYEQFSPGLGSKSMDFRLQAPEAQPERVQQMMCVHKAYLLEVSCSIHLVHHQMFQNHLLLRLLHHALLDSQPSHQPSKHVTALISCRHKQDRFP